MTKKEKRVDNWLQIWCGSDNGPYHSVSYYRSVIPKNKYQKSWFCPQHMYCCRIFYKINFNIINKNIKTWRDVITSLNYPWKNIIIFLSICTCFLFTFYMVLPRLCAICVDPFTSIICLNTTDFSKNREFVVRINLRRRNVYSQCLNTHCFR